MRCWAPLRMDSRWREWRWELFEFFPRLVDHSQQLVVQCKIIVL